MQVRSGIALSLDEQHVYFGSDDNTFGALDIYTGQQHWVFAVQGYVSIKLQIVSLVAPALAQ
jgi:outer membrane protein assembly factor BamB